MRDGSVAHDAGARVLELASGYLLSHALHIVAQLRVADHLQDGPVEVEELARRTGTNPDALFRLMRALTAHGMFRRDERGRFALDELGELLRSDHPHSLRNKVLLSGFLADSFSDALTSVRTGRPVFEARHGKTFFDYVRSEREIGRLFTSAMMEQSREESRAVAEAYDFGVASRVVDVGGGSGSQLAAILDTQPNLEGVVFDLPHVAEQATSVITAQGLSERCAFVGGDFFREVPSDGDCYLLKSVLHDWADTEATEILRICRAASGPGDLLVVAERLLPAGDEPHPSKLFDLAMLVLLGGRERTAEELSTLLHAAGFEPLQVVPTDSALSLLVCRPLA